MPQIYNKLNDEPLDAGRLKTKIRVFDPARGVDAEGGVLRVPSGGGGRIGIALFPPETKLWEDYCSMESYGVQARSTNGKESSEKWATLTCAFMEKKPYVDGMIIQVLKTGEWFQIQGDVNISDANIKTEITCRRVA
jgi:hypothetical protein